MSDSQKLPHAEFAVPSSFVAFSWLSILTPEHAPPRVCVATGAFPRVAVCVTAFNPHDSPLGGYSRWYNFHLKIGNTGNREVNCPAWGHTSNSQHEETRLLALL